MHSFRRVAVNDPKRSTHEKTVPRFVLDRAGGFFTRAAREDGANAALAAQQLFSEAIQVPRASLHLHDFQRCGLERITMRG